MVKPRSVTMDDVAAGAGVSRMTVSYTFNRPGRVSPETRERVLRAARAIGYARPDSAARSLRLGRYDMLGVVLGEQLTYAFSDRQAADFLAGAASVCVDRGLGLTLLPVERDSPTTARITTLAVDALIAWTLAEDDPIIPVLAASGLPVVVHGGVHTAGVSTLSIDDASAAAAVGQMVFVGRGKPSILALPSTWERREQVVLGPDPDESTFPVTRRRLVGFRAAIEAAGIDWATVPVAFMERNDPSRARPLARRLADEYGVDAIACMSDQAALAALGVVPPAVAVSGWDGDEAAVASGIPSIVQDLSNHGALAAARALDAVGGASPPDLLELPWTLASGAAHR